MLTSVPAHSSSCNGKVRGWIKLQFLAGPAHTPARLSLPPFLEIAQGTPSHRLQSSLQCPSQGVFTLSFQRSHCVWINRCGRPSNSSLYFYFLSHFTSLALSIPLYNFLIATLITISFSSGQQHCVNCLVEESTGNKHKKRSQTCL